MADQKHDDTKTPLTKRGARPFGGPAGTSGPSRPFPRPATPQRPTAAPFVAPVVPGKLVLRNAAPTPTAKTPTPVAPTPIRSTDIGPTSHPTPPVANEIGALDAIDAFDAMWGVSEASGRPVEPEPVTAPLDELSLGGGVDGQHPWAEDITANDVPAKDIPPLETEAAPPPVTVESSEVPSATTTPAWLEADAAAPVAATPGLVEPEMTFAETDAPPLPTVAQPVSEVGGGYAFGEWTDSHTIPAFDEIMGVQPEQSAAPVLEPLGDEAPTPAEWTGNEAHESPEPSLRFELATGNEESQPDSNGDEPQPAVVTALPASPVMTAVPAVQVQAYSPHEARIAAAFDRLADRVRSGEIDVSSIAPEATDAAVLASVLAALLGGSRSR
ncbi:MAG TPA: hypothetical protein VFW03_13070 [Gemmatimonadaceae bacterium]|nr:hypothetical protein [Gemmatimonadaceae bacterium]